MRRPCRAFSLVELIVVIGIIAVLVAMLAPVLSAANESARAVRCSSQLRQIGLAIFNYAASNRGMTPPWGGRFRIDNSTDPLSSGWPAMLWRHSGVKANSPLYHCPSFGVDDDTVNYFLTAHWEHLQSPEANSISLSRIRLASQFLLAAESTAQHAYVPPFGDRKDPRGDNKDKDDSGQRDLVFFGEPGGYNMHRGGNNILFADGHVRIFKRHDPSAITYCPDRMEDWDEVTGQ